MHNQALQHRRHFVQQPPHSVDLLHRQVDLLQYCVCASVKDYKFFNGFDPSIARHEDGGESRNRRNFRQSARGR